MNISCVICTELLTGDVSSNICGHLFHYGCIKQWMERSKTCPQCRKTCIERQLTKVYFNITTAHDTPDVSAIITKSEALTGQVDSLKKSKEKLEKEVSDLRYEKKNAAKVIAKLEAIRDKDSFIQKTFLKQIEELKNECKEKEKHIVELSKLRQQVNQMKAIEAFINCNADEAREILNEDMDRNTMAQLIINLRRELRASERKKNENWTELQSLKSRLQIETDKRIFAEEKGQEVATELFRLRRCSVPTLEESSRTPPLKRKSHDEEPNTSGGAVPRKVEKTDSPYLRVQSSIVGLTPIMRTGHRSIQERPINENIRNLSIFQQTRTVTKIPNPVRYGPDGMGGLERKENIPDFPNPINRFNISNRLKSGVLKKPSN